MRTLILLLIPFLSLAQLPESGPLSIKSAAGAGRSISQQVDGNETGNKSLTTLSTTAGFTAPHSMLEFRGWPSTPKPNPPENCLAINDYPNGPKLTFDPPSSGTAPTAYYMVMYENGVVKENAFIGLSTSYTYPAATLGRTYRFQIAACADIDGQNGTEISECSAFCNTGTITYEVIAPPPTAPSSVFVSLNSSGDIPISWSGATGDITTYRLERKVNAGSFTFLTNDAASPYTDETPTASNTYTYRVRAEGPGGASGYTESSSISTHEPDAPSNVTAVNDPSVISLSWTRPITGGTITSWSISRSENGGPFLLIATDYPSQTYLDAAVVVGRQYQYRVWGVNYFHANAPYGTSNLITRVIP